MNFFGHAAVASWLDRSPAYVLGAMLPDFQGMLRLRQLSIQSADVARGVALHHATDAAFHELPPFLELTRHAHSALTEQGILRGAARAVSHVGTELLLDEVLARDTAAVEAYSDALATADRAELLLEFADPDDARSFRDLTRTLRERSLVASAPERVAARLFHILKDRPRLAFPSEQQRLIAEWVVASRPAVETCAEAIIAGLRHHLNAQP